MFKIGLADDHEIVRSGLSMIIESHKMKVVISASSLVALMKALDTTSIDLLVLDLNLGDSNGLDSIKKIKGILPELPILILSAYPEEIYAIRAFKAGASGYLNKTILSNEVIRAIEEIMAGRKYVSQTLQESLPFGFSLEASAQDLLSTLSQRELEVLTLLSDGLTFQEIAKKLSLSPKTVSTYRTRILEKLHLENSAQLIQFAFELRQTS